MTRVGLAAGAFAGNIMANLIWRSLGAVAVCGGFYLLTNRLLGPVVWVFLALVIGISFSRILIDATAELSWWSRRLALEPLAGIHYKFQTFRVHVVEDEDHCRWIATEEVRKIVGQLASDQALAKLFPSGHQYLGKNKKGYLRDDALITHLANATTPQAIKFKNWAERNVAFPARKIRQRKGIAIAPAAAERDD
jgi:hypothetical protein